MKNEISYRVDADTKPYRSKMDGLKKTTKDASNHIVGSFKQMAASMAAAFTLQSAKGVAQWADDLGTLAAAIGVSTEFLQRFQAANIKSGVSAGVATKAIEKFADNIGEAQRGEGEFLKVLKELGIELRDKAGRLKTVEELLWEYADAMKNAKTEQQALSLSSEAFGAKNKQLVATLTQGGEALKKQVDSMTALSDAHVAALAQANEEWELTAHWLKLIGAYVGSGIYRAVAAVPRFLGAATGGADMADQLTAGSGWKPNAIGLSKVEAVLKSQAEAKQHALDEQAKKEAEILATKKKVTEEEKKQADKLRETLLKEQQRLTTLGDQLRTKRQQIEADMGSAVRNRFGLSVSEAANPSNPYVARFGLSAAGQQNVQTARRIQDLENYAQYARLNRGAPGAYEAEMNAMSEADRLRAGLESLTDDERNPFRSLQEELQKLIDQDHEFYTRITDNGMKLRAN
jgi:hypothetical protein